MTGHDWQGESIHAGALPIHLAAQLKTCPEVVEVIQALLDVHPAGAGVADLSNVALPLHYALEVNDHSEVTDALSRAHPESAAIAASWEEIRRHDKKSVLRLRGFGSLQRTQIRTALEKFGRIEHLHHVQDKSSESIVIFVSEEDALAAYNAHLNDDGVVKVLPGMPLHFDDVDVAAQGSPVYVTTMGIAAASKSIDGPARRVVSYKYGTTKESGYFIYNDTSYDTYWDNLEAAVGAMKPLLGGYESWLRRCKKAEADHACVREVANLQLQLSEELELRPGLEEQIGMWQRTMQMIRDKKLSMHVDRFADTLLELLSFCDQVFSACPCLCLRIASHMHAAACAVYFAGRISVCGHTPCCLHVSNIAHSPVCCSRCLQEGE